MNQRQYVRNIGRIPRLLFHIKRCKANGQDDRVKGFENELERRKLEMKLADFQEKSEAHPKGFKLKEYGKLLDTLLKIKLEHHETDDSKKLKAMVAEASVGMPTGAAELTPAGTTVN